MLSSTNNYKLMRKSSLWCCFPIKWRKTAGLCLGKVDFKGLISPFGCTSEHLVQVWCEVSLVASVTLTSGVRFPRKPGGSDWTAGMAENLQEVMQLQLMQVWRFPHFNHTQVLSGTESLNFIDLFVFWYGSAGVPGITLLLRGSISDKASLCDKWPRIPAGLDNILLFLFTHLSLLRRSTSLPTNSDQLPWTDFGKEFMLHAKAAKQAQTITPPLPCPTLGGRGGCFLKGFWIFLMFTLITRVHRVEQNWMSLLVLSVRLNPSSHQSWKQQISIGVGDYGYQSDTKLDRASFTNAHSFTVNVMIMQ